MCLHGPRRSPELERGALPTLTPLQGATYLLWQGCDKLRGKGMVGFTRESIELVGGEWSVAEKFNGVLERLNAQCHSRVERRTDLARSKTAWKLANYRLAVIYRG